MHDRVASSKTPSTEYQKAPLARAVILRQSDYALQTFGFPAIRPTPPKQVTFPNPVRARCRSLDGVESFDCLVVSVWETGALLQVDGAADITDFNLLFTSSFRPVYRHCRKVSARGNMIRVAYQRMQPDFLMKAGLDL